MLFPMVCPIASIYYLFNFNVNIKPMLIMKYYTSYYCDMK